MTISRRGPALLEGVSDEALVAAVAEFYSRMLADERVAHYFENVNIPKLRAHQRSFLVAALGEPGTFNSLTLEHAHFPLSVRKDEFDIALEHLGASLRVAGVPADNVDAIAARVGLMRMHIVAPAER
jgi:hemoglobin